MENNTMENNDIILQYILYLTEKEKIALKKAEEILGTSFNIRKSIGFIKWNNNNNNNNNNNK